MSVVVGAESSRCRPVRVLAPYGELVVQGFESFGELRAPPLKSRPAMSGIRAAKGPAQEVPKSGA